ncbi:peroxidase family protein, partial [cf. Phormidesmis sp. LEGE 11477]|uniref:peroxidase family protein n=1 Tax=cf. Phormidesmis sp. LEGE 11477 TaxID=1828680 RepID=UPI0019E7024F
VIGKVDVRGTVSDDSLLAAEQFTKQVKIERQTIDPELDSRFLTPSKVSSDIDAPIVTLALVEDTGSADDDVTSVPTVAGTVLDQSDIAGLKISLVDAADSSPPISSYVDASQYLQSGSFTLDIAALETALGQPLADGRYTLRAVAEDSFGNVSEPVAYSYTFDTEGPALLVTELQTVATEDGLIRLVGSVNEAVTATVTLAGETPITFEIPAGTFEQALQALPTEAGDYALALTLTDAAGNITQTTLDFVVEDDTSGPGTDLAPIFESIEPLTVTAGQKIEIPLTATDPEGQIVTYSFKSEGDLPTGRLDGSGRLIFEPTPNQIGTYDFTLVATDGVNETTQQVSLTVAPDPDTTTRISGQILDTEGNPLANLPLALGRLQVVTDENGYFTFVVPETSFPTEEIDIAIPLGDSAFDPFFTGTSEINLRRTTFDGATGTSISNPLRHPNLVSTFMDASMVYGTNESRAIALRTNDGTGRLKVSDGDLLPINNSETFPDGVLANSNR